MKGKLHGNGLWESSRMMLPEHKEAILEYNRRLHRHARVLLDEQEMEEISRRIARSLREHREIGLKLYGEFEGRRVRGVVEAVRPGERRFRLNTGKDVEWIAFTDIVSAE
ncbi:MULTISPECIES: YolD-like family protein [Paenibacillus]|uniref:YolD-like family protein n=1 Tax=Paenibacillus TaxID=44249 RepID=UPI002FE24C38